MAGGGEQGPKCRSWSAQGTYRLGLVVTDAVDQQCLRRRRWEAQPGINPLLQGVEVGQHPVLEGPVGDQGPLRGASPGHRRVGRQSQDVARVEELGAQLFHPSGVEGASTMGGDGRGHLGLAEAGPAGAQPLVGIDQVGKDHPGARRGPHTAPPAHLLRYLLWAAEAHGGGLLGPALRQHFGRYGVNLARAGGEACGLVGGHAFLGALRRRRAVGLQPGLDLGRALGERPQLGLLEADDLASSVAVGPPGQPERGGEPAAQLLLVDTARGSGPLVEGGGVEGHVAPVGPSHQVGDHGVGVQLGIAGARGSMHEGGHGQSARRDLRPHSVLLLAGDGHVGLEERHRGADRFYVGQRHLALDLRSAEGPQNGRRLGRREGGVERVDLARRALQQCCPCSRVGALHQPPERLGFDYARQLKALGPATGPHAWCLPT